MAAQSATTAVFVGPSLARAEVRRVLPGVRVEPPIARGDIERLLGAGVRRFVVIDGAFAHELAVAPSEIVGALRAGAHIVGAASMGAIRAAECRPAGMDGVGAVYALYRMRVISDDDEVAVAAEPERDFAATSTALINVRFMVLGALRGGLLSRSAAAAVLRIGKQQHFSERSWPTILQAAGVPQTASLTRIGQTTDIKARDARLALAHAARLAPAQVLRTFPQSPQTAHREHRRYRGHDPRFGHGAARLRRELSQWLVASGRYRRLTGAAPSGSAGPIDTSDLWSRLVRTGELDAESMRWHAVQRASAVDAGLPSDVLLSEAQRYVAGQHGYDSWDELVGEARAERLGSIPVAMIEDACRSLARARRNIHCTTVPTSTRSAD